MLFKNTSLPRAEDALPGREDAMPLPNAHLVLGNSLAPPFPKHTASIQFGMGCFWGAERRFWQQADVYSTAVGYAGGFTPNPSYEEVCSGHTGHTEAVLVVYNDTPEVLANLLAVFWESHDPTQGMRQGNDGGTQYRSAIYASNDAQLKAALASREKYQRALDHAKLPTITTEIKAQVPFYYAEDYHQQYLAKHPSGYCGLAGTGVCLA